MRRTFLITIEVDDPSPYGLSSVADDIEADLEANFEVISVKPWGQGEANAGLSGPLGPGPGPEGSPGPSDSGLLG